MNTPLHFVIDRPASACRADAVNIGPTCVDFSVLGKDSLAAQVQSEERHIAEWREHDRSAVYGYASKGRK